MAFLHCAATKYGTVQSTRATRVDVVLAAAIAKVEELPSLRLDLTLLYWAYAPIK